MNASDHTAEFDHDRYFIESPDDDGLWGIGDRAHGCDRVAQTFSKAKAIRMFRALIALDGQPAESLAEMECAASRASLAEHERVICELQVQAFQLTTELEGLRSLIDDLHAARNNYGSVPEKAAPVTSKRRRRGAT